MPTEKTNGSANYDKGKKTKGEPPSTKQEREEMKALLDELCGHLGQSSRIQLLCRRSLAHPINSHVSKPILGRRRRRKKLLVHHRQAAAAANIQLGVLFVYHLPHVYFIVTHAPTDLHYETLADTRYL